MKENEINNEKRAAVAIMSLGRELAAEVMKYLNESEVKRLSRALMGVNEVERFTQKEIASEFLQMLRAADKLVVDGREFAKDVIGTAFGKEAGDPLLEYVGGPGESLSALMQDIPDTVVDEFIQSEHPQTIAFLLTAMEPKLAAQLLGKMREELQTDVLIRISQLDHVRGEVIEEVREVLRTQLRGVSFAEGEKVGGTKAAAGILNFVERRNEDRILNEIEEVLPELAEQIRNFMFMFEDISRLDDRNVQTLLKEVPRDQLVLALKTASEELKELLFRNISQRAADLLKDDLDVLGPTPLRDVQRAQQSIVDIVRRLEAEGRINVHSSGEEIMV